MPFEYNTSVKPEWIDYNGHMQDAYYGLVFSYAVDAFQDWVGFDIAYRTETDCTIYLVEEHKYFLREVKESDPITVQINVLGVSEKVFHLYCVMKSGGHDVAFGIDGNACLPKTNPQGCAYSIGYCSAVKRVDHIRHTEISNRTPCACDAY